MVGTGLKCLMKRDAREVRYLAWLAVEDSCHRRPAGESYVLPDVFRPRLKKKWLRKSPTAVLLIGLCSTTSAGSGAAFGTTSASNSSQASPMSA